MRNPFPKIGKVIKYDFKHSSRKLLPLYAALLVLGLLTGLFAEPVGKNRHFEESINSSSYEWHMSSADENFSREMMTGLLVFAFVVLSVVSIVMTVTSIARRFSQSMLEDEAYLNLSLPVTMGEHLWGKFIMAFGWMFCCCIITALSGLLCFIRMDLPSIFSQISESMPEFKDSLAYYGMSIGRLVGLAIMLSITFAFFIITLIFIVNAISHLFKKNKGLVKFVTVVVLFWINGWLFKLVPSFDTRQFDVMQQVGAAFTKSMCITALILFLISAAYFAVTQYIFTKKLNLE